MPANNVIASHSLLALSGYKEIIKQKQSTMPHLVGLSRHEADYILLDEEFCQLLINEHYTLCKFYSLENIQKRQEEEKILGEKLEKAKELNDYQIMQDLEHEDILRELKLIEMEQDKSNCHQRS